MEIKYEEALLSSDISYDTLISGITMPKKLYKYQCFYDESGKQNPYWMDNMKGTFHLSLGSEFEDKNDCKPYIDVDQVWSIIERFLYSMKIENNKIEDIKRQIYKNIKNTLFDDIAHNYQTNIRIGCFTTNSDNYMMWNKYACFCKGYCIEYNTEGNVLFNNSTLPVVYRNTPYDSSITFANQLILECCREGKNRNVEEQLKIYHSIYEKIIKTAYIPIFLKEKEKWEFENEFRMFLLKNRNTRVGLIKASDYIKENDNIDLSREVAAIYLGTKFDENKGSSDILERICDNLGGTKIQVYKKNITDGKIINDRII